MTRVTVHSIARKVSLVSVFSLLMIAFSSTAIAQCGSAFSSLAAGAISVKSRSQLSKSPSSVELVAGSGDTSVNPSIVGLWHTQFIVGNQTIQEAFQIWNTGGTEVHNPNVDPRGGTVCLGTWRQDRQVFKLVHRVWNHDTNGNFLGTIHLTELVSLGDRGGTYSGSFTLDFYDPAGNFQFSVTGDVVAERISAD